MFLDDFNLDSLTFEVRFEPAYELWDQAGAFWRRLTQIFPGIETHSIQPNVQTFRNRDVQLELNLTRLNITWPSVGSFDGLKSEQLKKSYQALRELLGLQELTQVSARCQYVKLFSSHKDANASILQLGLTSWPDGRVFDQPQDGERNSVEVVYRFDDTKSFSLVRIKTEKVTFKVEIDARLNMDNVTEHRNKLIVEFDRGLLGDINAAELRIEDWFKGYFHLLRRDIDKVLRLRQ